MLQINSESFRNRVHTVQWSMSIASMLYSRNKLLIDQEMGGFRFQFIPASCVLFCLGSGASFQYKENWLFYKVIMLKTKQKKNLIHFLKFLRPKKKHHIKLTVLCFVTYMDCHDWSTKKNSPKNQGEKTSWFIITIDMFCRCIFHLLLGYKINVVFGLTLDRWLYDLPAYSCYLYYLCHLCLLNRINNICECWSPKTSISTCVKYYL